MAAVALSHEVRGRQDAPVLVLGGSLGTSYEMWDPQIDALAERLRVVRYSQRGHGASPVPPGPYAIADLGGDVLALLDRLGVERASFCGLSIGGMTGMWLAAHAPDRIDRLTLICTSAHLPGEWTERAAVVRAAGTTEPVADAALERWFTPAFAAAHPDVAAWVRAMIVSVPAEGYAACCEAIGAMDLRPDLAAIAAPTLVIAGAGDPSTPPDHAEAIVAGIDGARLELLDPARHLASVERAAAVTDLILQHLDHLEAQ